MTAILECNGVWKQYGKKTRGIKDLLVGKSTPANSRYDREWALQNVNFKVEKGSSFGIIGHNGTGKSTLLSLLLGVILPDKGSINCNGRIASLLELGAGFHPELTGRENIFLYGTILGMSRAEIRKNFDAIVAFSELGDAIENPIRTYSSGMTARLGFSTIIHTQTDLLLIDEVLAVGDSQFQQKCIDYLRKFKDREGTLIIVSHDLATLEKMCENGICLEMGQIRHMGPIKEVIDNYLHVLDKA